VFRGICSQKFPIPPTPYRPKGFSKALQIVIIIVCSICGGLILIWIFFWATRVRKRWLESKVEAFADEHAKNTRHVLFGNYRDEWEVTPKELKVDANHILGQGAFAVVYQGYLKKKRNNEFIEMDVAVKFARFNAEEWMR
jgi:hypothetical protein